MSAEAELLLRCTRVWIDDGAKSRVNARLESDLCWPAVRDSARRHGLLPLLYWHLNAHGLSTKDPAIVSTLRQEFRRTAHRNLVRVQELLAITELFETNGIPAIPFKGPTLALSVYGDLALRPFCDLDVLVPREQVDTARDLVLARGYEPEYRLSAVHEAAWLRARHDLNLRRPDLDIVVELHWALVPRRLCVDFDLTGIWARARWISIGGRQIRTLSPEDLLVALCAHGAKHGWSRLIWICDVAALVERGGLDWDRVVSEARRLGIARMLFLGLRLASDVAKCHLPNAVQRLAEDRTTKTLTRNVRDRLFAPTTGAKAVVQRSLFHVRIRERLRDKIRVVLSSTLVPSAADRLLVGLPTPLAFLYYLLRPFRLARKYLWQPATSEPSGFP